MEPIRVLQTLHSMNRGGAENALMNFYRHIDRSVVQFDFLITDSEHTQFEDEISALGGRIYRIPKLSLRNFFKYMYGVYKFIRSHPDYRIIHSHTSSKSVLPLWVAKVCGVPVRISHSHAAKYAKGIRGLQQAILRPLLPYVATHKLACGKDAAVWLYGKDSYLSGDSLVFKNVIESEKFDYNKEVRSKIRGYHNIDDSTIVIGNVARLCYQKNQQYAIRVLSELIKTNVKAKLMLVGIGEDECHLKKLAKELNIQDNVIFTGVVSNTFDYYQAFDFFILPSIYEGLPLVLTEAQISGLKCLSSNTVDEDSDVTGLVEFLSIDSAPSSWAEFITSEYPYERCSHRRDIIQSGYDATTAASSLQRFYIKCLKGYEQEKDS